MMIPVGEGVITVNASAASDGNVTCRIRWHSVTDVDIDIEMVDNEDGTDSLLYTPRIPDADTINIKFGGPSEAKMTCRDNHDGSCTVEYLPTKKGVYDITVKFAEQHIPGK